ncbi:hypothetical protein QCA50_020798 [Cerrena zonata]|uniref:Uncharacterized protein n=1 Tax=Cerrena zonata TaxID=2478898 RepID=A0AAW0FG91_9APHY
MSSNNPFAAALNEPNSYVHRRDPPPPPVSRAYNQSSTPPSRPPKPENSSSSSIPPPSYEEAAGPEKIKSDYPREKSSSSSFSRYNSSKPHHPVMKDAEIVMIEIVIEKDVIDLPKTDLLLGRKPEPVKAKNLDTIDKLDVTAFFGGGFHHDGPFDACTPHRNKNQKQAPVMAFPADGPNNSIKGLAPNVNDDERMNLAFGNYDDNDHNQIVGRTGSVKKKVVTPPSSSHPINDAIDGTDAIPLIKTNKASADPSTTLYTPKQNPSDLLLSLMVLQLQEFKMKISSPFGNGGNAGGLGRKKSLVQRLRKNSASEHSSRRNSGDTNSALSTSPDAEYGRASFGDDPVVGNNGGNSLLKRVKSLKVGGKRG